MDENKLKVIIEEVVTNSFAPLNKRFDGLENRFDGLEQRLRNVEEQLSDEDTGLAAINRRLDANTGAIMELEKTVKGYGDMYKINGSNLKKAEKRLEHLEENVGLEVQRELKFEPLPEAA